MNGRQFIDQGQNFKRGQTLLLGAQRELVKYVKMVDKNARPYYVVVQRASGAKVTAWADDLEV